MSNNPTERSLRAIAGSDDTPLEIGVLSIPAYVLEDETRVIARREMQIGLGLYAGGAHYARSGIVELPAFVNREWLSPSIDAALAESLNSPIRFQSPKGGIAYGYPASVLVDLCSAIMLADQAGHTTPRQERIVKSATALVMAAAKTTIDILIDEVTGYDQQVVLTAAQRLHQYLAIELQPYVRTFPLEFYQHIYRLNGWNDINITDRPGVVGKMTNELIYDRITPGLRESLERLNPKQQNTGRRKHHHHRHLTPEEGRIELLKHISSIITLMRIAENWEHLKALVAKAHPKPTEQLPLWVFEEVTKAKGDKSDDANTNAPSGND